MSRAFNFSAGPATLPEAVLRQAQDEMLDFRGAGASIVELSHRGPEFIEVAAEAVDQQQRVLAGSVLTQLQVTHFDSAQCDRLKFILKPSNRQYLYF